MQALIDECPSISLGTAAYSQQILAEILKQPACQQLVALLMSTSSSTDIPVPPLNGFSSALDAPKRSAINLSASTDAILSIEEELLFPLDIRLLLTTIFVVLSLMGIIGNLMVITVVLRVPGMVSFDEIIVEITQPQRLLQPTAI